MNFLHRPSVESPLMKRILQGLVVVALLLTSGGRMQAEKVGDLPAPTGYVNDFAGVLTDSTKQSVEDLCTRVDRQAHAQIAVVTIKTLDDDQSIEEFATALEEKWKVGAKGTDRGVLMVLVMNPRRGRIEVGYGLESILNDAKVGDIGRLMAPYSQKNDYDDAVKLGVKQLTDVIASDAGVTLDTGLGVHQYHWQEQQAQPVQISFGKVILVGGIALVVLILLASTGNLGLVFWFLLNMLGRGGGRGGGGGWRGGGGGDGDGGGGFGGFGGGRSGGGGASGDF